MCSEDNLRIKPLAVNARTTLILRNISSAASEDSVRALFPADSPKVTPNAAALPQIVLREHIVRSLAWGDIEETYACLDLEEKYSCLNLTALAFPTPRPPPLSASTRYSHGSIDGS